jgi:hypothetical protein
LKSCCSSGLWRESARETRGPTDRSPRLDQSSARAHSSKQGGSLPLVARAERAVGVGDVEKLGIPICEAWRKEALCPSGCRFPSPRIDRLRTRRPTANARWLTVRKPYFMEFPKIRGVGLS